MRKESVVVLISFIWAVREVSEMWTGYPLDGKILDLLKVNVSNDRRNHYGS